MNAPWTDDESDQLRALHADGASLHSIAKTMGRSKDTISRKAAALGLSWSRDRTAAAAHALAVDGKARRQKIVVRVYDEAEALLTDLEAGRAGRGWRTVLKGEYGAEETRSLDFIPPTDRRTIADALNRQLMSAAKLEAVDATDGAEQEKSLLRQLGESLGVTGPGT